MAVLKLHAVFLMPGGYFRNYITHNLSSNTARYDFAFEISFRTLSH